MKKLLGLFLTALVMISSNAFAVSNLHSIDDYIYVIRSGSPMAIREACKDLQFSGITDSTVFDLINTRITQTIPTNGRKLQLGDAYELVVALASSGDKKYLPTLQKIADNSDVQGKVEAKAKLAISLLPKYGNINKKLADKKAYKKTLSYQENRLAILLHSGDYHLMDVAAKAINDKRLYSIGMMGELAAALKKHYKKDIEGREFTEALGHMVKTLASSTAKKYSGLVTDVAFGSANDKVKNYGKQAEVYYR